MKRRYLPIAAALVLLAARASILFLKKDNSGIIPPEPVFPVTAESRPAAEPGKPDLSVIPAVREISDAVRKIVDDSGNISLRVKLVNRLPGNLSATDRQALYDYLKYGPNSRETHHLKNDILNELRNQLTPPPELTQVMLDIFYDEKQSMTMRSYALQHMRPWYWEENMRDPAVKQAFYDGLEQSGNELSGVALLALTYLAEELPDEFDRTFIAEKAAALAGTPEVSKLTQISALDVSSRYGNRSALEIARNILKTDRDDVMLRAAACGAIGRLGDASDLELLERTGAGSPAVRAAVSFAEKQISARAGIKAADQSNN